MRFAALVVALVFVALLSACGSSGVDPNDRAVAVATTACGDASKTVGSGVVVGPGRVLTAAHVVVGATAVGVDTGIDMVPADIAVLDATRDLAIVTVDPDALPTDADIELTDAVAGDTLTVIGATSGVVELAVDRVLSLRADNVREPGRSLRAGYELGATLLPGDSGAGVFDAAGNLVAIVFSGPEARDGRVFAVGADEIRAVLGAPSAEWICEPADSRVRQSSETGG